MGKLVPFRMRGGEGEAPGGPSGAATGRFHVRIRLGIGSATDARPSRHVVSDARRSEEVREVAGPDPDLERRRRRRRRVRNLLLGAVFVGGCIAALVGERGYLDSRRAQRELEDIARQVAEQERKVAELRNQAVRLRTDPSALERVAREHLGLARPGEVVVLFAGGEEGRGELFPHARSPRAEAAGPEPEGGAGARPAGRSRRQEPVRRRGEEAP